jgi:hypothetical protein
MEVIEMPMIIGLLIVMAAAYQLFFRYDSWQNEEKPGVVYEHDNLTGETRVLKAGTRLNVFARIMGQGGNGEIGENGHRYLEPFDGDSRDSNERVEPERTNTENPENLNLNDKAQVEKVARPVPIPREVVIASSAPPVPRAELESYDTLEESKPFAVRQIDLNRDGSVEEIIQNATHPDGLLDISIVKNGREIFYGRGKQLALLPSRNQGWADIALKIGAKTLQVFRYDVKDASYKAMDNT